MRKFARVLILSLALIAASPAAHAQSIFKDAGSILKALAAEEALPYPTQRLAAVCAMHCVSAQKPSLVTLAKQTGSSMILWRIFRFQVG